MTKKICKILAKRLRGLGEELVNNGFRHFSQMEYYKQLIDISEQLEND